jgi:hypothetical protein
MDSTGQQISLQFFENVQVRLTKKGYIEVRPPGNHEIAMMKQTFGGTIPKIIAILNATKTTNNPQTLYQRHEEWFKKILGNTGAGILLFVYIKPSNSIINEALELGKGMLGYGQVVAGVYDLASNQYWMSDHMGWPDEIFG